MLPVQRDGAAGALRRVAVEIAPIKDQVMRLVRVWSRFGSRSNEIVGKNARSWIHLHADEAIVMCSRCQGYDCSSRSDQTRHEGGLCRVHSAGAIRLQASIRGFGSDDKPACPRLLREEKGAGVGSPGGEGDEITEPCTIERTLKIAAGGDMDRPAG